MPYPYTVETLQNFSPNSSRSVFQADVEKVNRLCEAVAVMRVGNPVPTDGDKIICITPSKGQVSDRGYLECRENLITICADPSGIHLDAFQDGGIYTSASGGPWTGYLSDAQFLEQAHYVGRAAATFWTWGRWGAQANGGVYFEADVFLWRFTAKADL